MIVVTGAAGHLGRGVVENLLGRYPASQIVATLRDPARAGTLAARGVTIRRADFADPASMVAAFRGAEQVLIVSVDQFGEEARRLHAAAFEAARRAGAERVLYTSHMGALPGSAFADHVAAEDAMAAAGGAFTALRNGFYAESALHLIGSGIADGLIRAPEDGPVSWTPRADLAIAIAAILAGPTRFDGATPPLVATESFDMAAVAALASEMTGREIKRVVVPDDDWQAEKLAQGVPPGLVHALLGMYRSARRGDLVSNDPTLTHLLGRTPQSLRDTLPTQLG